MLWIILTSLDNWKGLILEDKRIIDFIDLWTGKKPTKKIFFLEIRRDLSFFRLLLHFPTRVCRILKKQDISKENSWVGKSPENNECYNLTEIGSFLLHSAGKSLLVPFVQPDAAFPLL